ncbi:ubiquitin recognition factor in ER-associated degradation protein 1-like [Sycon ciliatum]|uniref:ubiquitin recognition factor in ER-associated degradation protein 1-like n=1 Tax=Sycon ciliatum TaxID=27933 RepID=UPI0031F6BC1F
MFSSSDYAPEGFAGLPGMHARGGRMFKAQYRCYSVTMFTDRKEIEEGGKIIMPPSALDQLTQLNTQYPMLFKLTNPGTANTTSHCGVLEFIADEGKVFIPYWMMQNLCLAEGDFLNVESAILPLGNYAQVQPQSKEFLDIYNPKAVLEASLRKLSCLSKDDMLKIAYNQKVYQFRVLKLKPADAVSIIECDLSVDFAPYVGHEEDERQQQAERQKRVHPLEQAAEQLRISEEKRIEKAVREAVEQSGGFKVFHGAGNVLDAGGRGAKKGRKRGKAAAGSGGASSAPNGASTDGAAENMDSAEPRTRGVPNYNYVKGTLTFARVFPKKQDLDKEEDASFNAFGGSGHCLRKRRR